MLRNEEIKRKNGVRSVFVLVILFVILLAAASGVSFAKNLLSSSGGDNAQVSTLIIDLNGGVSDNLAIDCGQENTTASYNFSVTNTKDGKTSELSFKYDVIVTLPEALPKGVSITVDGTSGTVSSDGKKVTFTDVGRFAAGNSQTHEHKMYYVFLDEIQKVASVKNPHLDDTEEKIGFVDVVLGLMKKPNVDVYITGSNSKMLSSDIVTEFRGRGDEIRVSPLSYKEFYAAYEGDKRQAWYDERGVLYLGIERFLLDDSALE